MRYGYFSERKSVDKGSWIISFIFRHKLVVSQLWEPLECHFRKFTDQSNQSCPNATCPNSTVSQCIVSILNKNIILCIFFKQNVSRHASSLFRHFQLIILELVQRLYRWNVLETFEFLVWRKIWWGLRSKPRYSATLEIQKFPEHSTYKVSVPVSV